MENFKERLHRSFGRVQNAAEIQKNRAAVTAKELKNKTEDKMDNNSVKIEAKKVELKAKAESFKEKMEDQAENIINITGEKLESVKDAAHREIELAKASGVHAAQEAGDTFKVLHEKTVNAQNDVKYGLHRVNRDIHRASKNIVRDLKK